MTPGWQEKKAGVLEVLSCELCFWIAPFCKEKKSFYFTSSNDIFHTQVHEHVTCCSHPNCKCNMSFYQESHNFETTIYLLGYRQNFVSFFFLFLTS